MKRVFPQTLMLVACLQTTFAAVAADDAVEPFGFDINVERMRASASPVELGGALHSGSTDALGRQAFTWKRQPLPAALQKSGGAMSAEQAARIHLFGTALPKSAGDNAESLRFKVASALPGGAAIVQFEAEAGGIPILREDVSVLLDRDLGMVALRGPMPKDAPTSLVFDYREPAEAAIEAAFGLIPGAKPLPVQLSDRRVEGDHVSFTVKPLARGGSMPVPTDFARAKKVLFRTADGLQPAWHVEIGYSIREGAPDEAAALVLSAVDRSLLYRTSLVSHAEAFTYKVWAENAPTFQPHPSPNGRGRITDPDGLPTEDFAPIVDQSSVTLVNTPFSRSGTDPWLADNAATTAGNNAIAYADLAAPSGFGDGDRAPLLTAPRTFGLTYDHFLEPSDDPIQTTASAVQAFYTVNWLHDWFYDAGFGEADRNGQLDNFGRGGLDGDPILVEARHHALGRTAQIVIYSDGEPSRMQLGYEPNVKVSADVALDSQVVAHEWAHFLTHRLIGDTLGLDTLQSSGMGEGWSDFVALLATAKDSDRERPGNANLQGAYAIGPYVFHSYYGPRRYPYSTDMQKNPLSLRYLESDLALPEGVPAAFGENGRRNYLSHQQGEVWASALWDAYVALLNDAPRDQFTAVQNRMKRYLVASLKMTPYSPTMVEGRDALLAVVLAEGAVRDHELMAAAFAKRGLGAGAYIPDRYSLFNFGVIESQLVGSALRITSLSYAPPIGCDTDNYLDIGEQADMLIRVQNVGMVDEPDVHVALSGDQPGLAFPEGDVVAVGALAIGESKDVRVPIRLTGAGAGTNATLSAMPQSQGLLAERLTGAELALTVHADRVLNSTDTELFQSLDSEWTQRFDRPEADQKPWSIEVEGSVRVLRGHDYHRSTISWLEAPVIEVGTDPLVVTLTDRYLLEQANDEIAFDGGLIQVSVDDGATWTDVDPEAAGYITGVLSDAYENPAAGRKAITGQSSFPEFEQHVLDFGTQFAPGTRVRLRFGVATDRSVLAGGWDIDSIQVEGAARPPFASVQAQTAACSVDALRTLQGAMSGTYYTPERSGEGVLLDMGQVAGQPVLFFSWYTYQDGVQKWLVGSAPFDEAARQVAVELVETRGTGFGDSFSAGDVIESSWGHVALSFPDCQTLRISYRRGDGENGVLDMNRALQNAPRAACGLLDGSRSGTYYDRSRSGEGVLVDFGQIDGQPVQFFSWYTYEEGAQRWLVGAQTHSASDASVTLDLVETAGTGFGRAFHRDQVEEAAWGSVTQRFLDCDTMEISYTRMDGASGVLQLERGLEQLGDGVCR
ncbi:MAG: M36 family metallopeptidase [Xanthomonadales bacterium]|nr:M36 family metallopeptidase [Xanthomonadales bacterium]